MRKTLAAFIILSFPIFASAHGSEPSLLADPGKLPGELWYTFERPAEWIELNLFTVSTKSKQSKRLSFADERAAELVALMFAPVHRASAYELGLRRYEHFLVSAEDMAEKIIFLDGAEIAIAERFEEQTRKHEKFFWEQKESGLNSDTAHYIDKALLLSRNQNEKMFRFMVEKYQGTDEDIEKHRRVLERHEALVRDALAAVSDEKLMEQIKALLAEAGKFRAAGLNLAAYDLIVSAKKLLN